MREGCWSGELGTGCAQVEESQRVVATQHLGRFRSAVSETFVFLAFLEISR